MHLARITSVLDDLDMSWSRFAPTEQIVLAADRSSASLARRFVRSTLESWDLHDLIEDSCIVVTELVTNAILHAGSAPTVRVSVDARRIHIEVTDDDPTLPLGRSAGEDATSGRGLRLVEALAAGWGSTRLDTGGKVVWCELEHAVAGGPTLQAVAGHGSQSPADGAQRHRTGQLHAIS